MTKTPTCVSWGGPCSACGIWVGSVPRAVPVVGRGLAALPGLYIDARGRGSHPGSLYSLAVFCKNTKKEGLFTLDQNRPLSLCSLTAYHFVFWTIETLGCFSTACVCLNLCGGGSAAKTRTPSGNINIDGNI